MNYFGPKGGGTMRQGTGGLSSQYYMKINIVGAAGSGVTSLGQSLSDKLNVPYFDSDDYYWEKTDPPFIRRRDPDQRNDLVTKELDQHQHWILGGSVINWGEYWKTAFDAIVFLWVSPEIRIERLKKREKERFGDIIFTDVSRNNQFSDFIEWASGYDSNTAKGRTIQAHQHWLSTVKCRVLKLTENNSVAQNTQNVKYWLEQL